MLCNFSACLLSSMHGQHQGSAFLVIATLLRKKKRFDLAYGTTENLMSCMQAGRVTDDILNLQGRGSESTAARVMCMYKSADRFSARLAILHGSQLTILSVRGMQSVFSHSSASTASAASTSANAGAEIEYADITSTIQPSQPMETQAEKAKRRQLRRLQIFVACGGPPAVLHDRLG